MKKLLILSLLIISGCSNQSTKNPECLSYQTDRWFKVIKKSKINNDYSLIVEEIGTSEIKLIVTSERSFAIDFMQVDCSLLNEILERKKVKETEETK